MCTRRLSRAAPMITRAQKRRRRLARREELQARGDLIRFTLAWAAGEMDHMSQWELERCRSAVLLQYRQARARHSRVLAELAS